MKAAAWGAIVLFFYTIFLALVIGKRFEWAESRLKSLETGRVNEYVNHPTEFSKSATTLPHIPLRSSGTSTSPSATTTSGTRRWWVRLKDDCIVEEKVR